MIQTRSLLLGACIALVAGQALAESVTLEPSKDNTLFEDSDGGLSNGSGDHIFAGRTVEPNNRRALLAFDIAGSIPAGASINSVGLVLNASRTTSGSQAISMHRVLADWGEGASNATGQEGRGANATSGDATWLHRFSTSDLWSTQGGDFSPAASATISVSGNGTYTWSSTAALVADVQTWVDDSSSNFGWILIGNESTSKTAKRFDSRENSGSVRPKLTVDFTPGVANSAPEVANAIGDQALNVGIDVFSVDLNADPAVFSDSDGDALSYMVTSSDELVATASVDGSTLTATPIGAGTATITVTASDPDSETAVSAFTVTATVPDLPPAVAAPIADQGLLAGGSGLDLELGSVFSDDGALTYDAASSDDGVATASTGGSTLSLAAVGSGSATITVTATDTQSQTGAATFDVTVTAIQGDFDENGIVDLDDFFAFADAFGSDPDSENWDAKFDLVPNSLVDLDDFFDFADEFGKRAE